MRASRVVSLAFASLSLTFAPRARADEPPAPTPTETPAATQVDLTKDTKPVTEDLTARDLATEAPPSTRYKKTLVLDSSLGAMAFMGKFGKVAPPGPWMHVQLGYEVLKWLMLYGEGEIAFTDTSNNQAAPNTRAFPLFGFGGGARFTARFTDRFGAYLQGGLGAMKADIATNALGLLGFRDAESLGLYLGGRLGVEWYQLDRHFALGLNAGIRLAQGFEKIGASRDTPLAIDGGASLRYAF
jgi:hypothetical protein